MERILKWEDYLFISRKYFPEAKVDIESLTEPTWFNAKENEAQYTIFKCMGANQMWYPNTYGKFIKLWNEEGRWYQTWLKNAIACRIFFLKEYFKDINQEIINSIKLNSYSIGGYSQSASPMSPQNYENLKNTDWTPDPKTLEWLQKLDFITTSLDCPSHPGNYWYNFGDTPNWHEIYDINLYVTPENLITVSKKTDDLHFIRFDLTVNLDKWSEVFASKVWVETEIQAILENLGNNVIIPINEKIETIENEIIDLDTKALNKDWDDYGFVEEDIKVNTVSPSQLNIHKIKVKTDGTKTRNEYDVNIGVSGGLNLNYSNPDSNTLNIQLQSNSSTGTYYGTYKDNAAFETFLASHLNPFDLGDYVLISSFTNNAGVTGPAQLTYNTTTTPDQKYPNWDEWELPASSGGSTELVSDTPSDLITYQDEYSRWHLAVTSNIRWLGKVWYDNGKMSYWTSNQENSIDISKNELTQTTFKNITDFTIEKITSGSGITNFVFANLSDAITSDSFARFLELLYAKWPVNTQNVIGAFTFNNFNLPSVDIDLQQTNITVSYWTNSLTFTNVNLHNFSGIYNNIQGVLSFTNSTINDIKIGDTPSTSATQGYSLTLNNSQINSIIDERARYTNTAIPTLTIDHNSKINTITNAGGSLSFIISNGSDFYNIPDGLDHLYLFAVNGGTTTFLLNINDFIAKNGMLYGPASNSSTFDITDNEITSLNNNTSFFYPNTTYTKTVALTCPQLNSFWSLFPEINSAGIGTNIIFKSCPQLTAIVFGNITDVPTTTCRLGLTLSEPNLKSVYIKSKNWVNQNAPNIGVIGTTQGTIDLYVNKGNWTTNSAYTFTLNSTNDTPIHFNIHVRPESDTSVISVGVNTGVTYTITKDYDPQ